MQQVVENQATTMLLESWQWQKLEGQRVALAQARGEEWRKRLSAIAESLNSWGVLVAVAVACGTLGIVVGINLPRGVVCLSTHPWCSHLRFVPQKTVIDWPPPR